MTSYYSSTENGIQCQQGMTFEIIPNHDLDSDDGSGSITAAQAKKGVERVGDSLAKQLLYDLHKEVEAADHRKVARFQISSIDTDGGKI